MPTYEIRRDATSGRFMSVTEARERPATAPARQGGICIETIHVSRNSVRLKRRRAARHLTDRNRAGFKAGRDL